MSTATNIKIHHTPASRGLIRRGVGYLRGRATLPIGVASCTVTNVGMLTDLSVVKVTQLGNVGNTAPLINIKSGNTNGMDGTITVGSADASVVTSDAEFAFIIENP